MAANTDAYSTWQSLFLLFSGRLTLKLILPPSAIRCMSLSQGIPELLHSERQVVSLLLLGSWVIQANHPEKASRRINFQSNSQIFPFLRFYEYRERQEECSYRTDLLPQMAKCRPAQKGMENSPASRGTASTSVAFSAEWIRKFTVAFAEDGMTFI